MDWMLKMCLLEPSCKHLLWPKTVTVKNRSEFSCQWKIQVECKQRKIYMWLTWVSQYCLPKGLWTLQEWGSYSVNIAEMVHSRRTQHISAFQVNTANWCMSLRLCRVRFIFSGSLISSQIVVWRSEYLIPQCLVLNWILTREHITWMNL